jgi:hypothetical protein
MEWVRWFDQKRLPEPLGFVPQAKLEAQHYCTSDTHSPELKRSPESPARFTTGRNTSNSAIWPRVPLRSESG